MERFYKLTVILFFLGAIMTSCQKDLQPPVITTKEASGIKSTSASAGGIISDDGGLPVFERGVCWSTSPNPSVNSFSATDGSTGNGSFTTNISGLIGNTKYYMRAYAINEAGISYGNEITFTTNEFSEFAFTQNATDVRFYKATVNGLINPENIATEVYFEYGTTTNYGNVICANQGIVSQNNTTVNATILGLIPAVTYHYRIKTINFNGISFGEDMTFDSNYLVGDTAQGGYVFYVDYSGKHGLAIATTNVGEYIPWSNGSLFSTEATGSTIGTGESNTESIVLAQGEGNYAAKLCENAEINGYTDWFLPSIDEIVEARQNLAREIHIGINIWSSTEVDESTAKIMSSPNGFQSDHAIVLKSDTLRSGMLMGTYDPISVVPIRSF